MTEQYTFAVARIRAKELSLFDRQDIEQLLACKSYQDCLNLLFDKGWGTGEEKTAEQILSIELQRTWELMRELIGDISVFDVFVYPIDFNNLKAAIKAVITNSATDGLFLNGGTVSPTHMIEAVRKKDFSEFPEFMKNAASEAYETLLHTGDGQLCDIILDRAALEAILSAGKDSDNELIQQYAELTVAVADIKIAVRGNKTGKSASFLKKAMAPCNTLNVDLLISATGKGMDDIFAYLAGTAYAAAVEELKKSPSAFEKWCDDIVIELIRGQKSNPFTIGPLAAYFLARQNEMKTARILLSGKLNQLSDGVIRERLREMYV